MSEVQLGKTTGSLVNALYALESVKVPSIGDGATTLSWTDRHPATVIDIEEKGKFVTSRLRRIMRAESTITAFQRIRSTFTYPTPRARSATGA